MASAAPPSSTTVERNPAQTAEEVSPKCRQYRLSTRDREAYSDVHTLTVEAFTRLRLARRERSRSTAATCDVLHVLWPGDYGGVETHVTGLVRGSTQRGDIVHRVCFLEGSGPTASALDGEGVVSSRLGFRRGWGPVGLWRFARVLRRTRPRLIHFHWRVLGAITVARVVLPRTPFVYTEHHPGAAVGHPKVSLFYRVLRRCFCRIVVTCDAMVGRVATYGVANDQIVLIPSGLTVPFRRPDDAMQSRGNVVGTVTRLDWPKRVDLFLEVLSELRARGVSCTGIVVGDGDRKELYEQHARRLGLAHIVEFPGETDDVSRWLDRFDVFLTTSSVETFGLAVLEAMARGVPAVGMPCAGGLPDLLRSGGVLVHDRDPKAAADAVERLLTSSAERARVARRGFELASGYTLEAALTKHARMYRELLTNGREPQHLAHSH
jgi:glycosyltransferase involved in cell wall biosynthesis